MTDYDWSDVNLRKIKAMLKICDRIGMLIGPIRAEDFCDPYMLEAMREEVAERAKPKSERKFTPEEKARVRWSIP